jgi:hypothetical protein
VFTDPSISAGSDWITGPDAISVTASHEALEMLADPILKRATRTRERDAGRFHVTFDDEVPEGQRRQKREGWRAPTGVSHRIIRDVDTLEPLTIRIHRVDDDRRRCRLIPM